MNQPAAQPLRRLIVQPDDGAAPVLEMVHGAKKSLKVKQFTLNDERLIEALVQARARGLDVRVMLNPARPDETRDNDTTMERLKAGGVEANWTSPAFVISHEKSLVADGEVALIATFNLSPKYFGETRDYGIVTTEAKQAAEIAMCFDADWERRPFTPPVNSTLVWSNLGSRDKMAELIDSARHTLDVQHPKFVDAVILERIVSALRRGVKVRVLCSGASGVRSWDQPETFASLRIMKGTRIRVRRQHRPKLHAKLVLADGKRALVGSMNIHRRAFDERRELGILLDDGPIVSKLAKVFAHDLSKATAYEVPDPLEAGLHNHETEDWAT